MRYSYKMSILRKNPALPIDKFPSLILSLNTIMSQHVIIQFSFNYLSTDHLQEVKSKTKLKYFATLRSKSGTGLLQEVVTRGYKYSDLMRKVLVFWKTGR